VNRQLLARATSLFQPGELLALRVTTASVFDVVLPALRGDGERAAASLDSEDVASAVTPVPSRVLDSLRAAGWSERGNCSDGALAIVRQCAGTLKELDCCLTENNDEWSEAVAHCARLELLTSASAFPPASWLGLSQLHTLLGVDLAVVSVTAIAAALSRLHTLGITTYFRPRPTAASVAGFFDTLLPRLRVFRFHGTEWPADDAISALPAPAPLPRLEEVIWEAIRMVDGFEGAQPVVLGAPYRAIAKFMAAGPLSYVRDLRLYGAASKTSVIAAVLRATPELRIFHAGLIQSRLEWRNDPAFAGLVHRKLRCVHFRAHPERLTEEDLQLPAEYDVLQAHHFPRLRGIELARKLWHRT
jgi:hypothetical protein